MIAELEKIVPVWPQISSIFSVPHDQESYDHLVAILDSLVDEVGDDEDHYLAGMMEVLGSLIESYEISQNYVKDGEPIALLKELMEQHGLTQKDLSEIGSQGVVSEIISGKRTMNIRQIKLLAARFGVSPAVFIA